MTALPIGSEAPASVLPRQLTVEEIKALESGALHPAARPTVITKAGVIPELIPLRPASAICCTVRVDAVAQQEAVNRVVEWPSGLVLHLCNSYTLALARKDEAYAAMLNEADLNLPDGTPLAWLGKRAGIPGFQRATRGPDLMRQALIQGRERGLRHFLYGSTPEVLELLQAEIEQFAPGALVVGAESPPFGDQDEDAFAAAAARMEAAGADVVWVGLGTPRQDWAAAALGRHLDAVIVPVGAAFDFLAGTKREAPAFLRDSGLEWVFRLMTEPRRLWRRYLVGNVGFLWGILRDGVRQV